MYKVVLERYSLKEEPSSFTIVLNILHDHLGMSKVKRKMCAENALSRSETAARSVHASFWISVTRTGLKFWAGLLLGTKLGSFYLESK